MRRVLFRNKSVQSLELDDFSKFEAGASLVVALLRKPEFCLSVCLSVCLSACLSVCLSVCVSVCVCVCLSVCSRSLSHGRSAHGVALAGPHTDAFNQTVANLNQRNQPFEPNRRNLNWIRNRTGGTGEPNR